jgi:hypothetical protein
MQHVGEPGSPETNRKDKRAEGLSPAQAFFILLALLVAIGGLFLLTRPSNEPASNSPPRSDNFALTDAEAIERFKELDALRIQALESRDPTLLSKIFTPSSPASSRISTSIRKLKRSDVRVRNDYQRQRLVVLRNEDTELVIQQAVTFDVQFFSESGEKVTQGGGLERQVIEWTLSRQGDTWLIENGVIVKAQPVD